MQMAKQNLRRLHPSAGRRAMPFRDDKKIHPQEKGQSEMTADLTFIYENADPKIQYLASCLAASTHLTAAEWVQMAIECEEVKQELQKTLEPKV